MSLAIACSPGSGHSDRQADEEVPLWVSSTEEPYPFTTPIPALEGTPIDGAYVRHVDELVAGAGFVPCRRCAPYRLEVGTTTITFDRGRFLIAHDAPRKPASSRFSSRGHFTVDGDRVVLFNDANCPQMTGVYEWRIVAGKLRFEVVEDPCPYSQLRERFLTATGWAG